MDDYYYYSEPFSGAQEAADFSTKLGFFYNPFLVAWKLS
jgi:hypothetical protein